MAPQSLASGITPGFSHHLHIQQKINIIRSTKVVFFAGLSSWVVHLFVHPVLLAPCFKNMAHSSPKSHQGWETYPRLEMTIRSSCATSTLAFHQVCIHRFMLFYLFMVCCLGRPIWTDSNADEAIKVPCLSQP